MGNVDFDYGAQYFSVQDSMFRARVDRWLAAGIVAKWPAAGPEAWVGVPGMNAPIVDLARRLDVKWSTRIEALTQHSDGWRVRGERIDAGGFESVVVALPAEQVAPLLRPLDPQMDAAAAATPSQPCWAVMAAFSEALPIEGDVLRGETTLSWAARNSAKPCRGATEAWVIHANPHWSLQHLEDAKETVAALLLDALAREIGHGLPKPVACVAHRWRYAKSGRTEQRHMWNDDTNIGLCGDWLIGPRVESAWLSGTSLATAIATR